MEAIHTVPAKTRRKLWLQAGLFLLTLVTTTAAGAMQNGVDILSEPWNFPSGLPFAVTLMTILLCHEMGHYLTARYHGVEATLPYFIPAPSFIGTFGAFIRMSARPPDRRSLFDVAAAGPLAGLILAVPAVIVGLQLSAVAPQDSAGEGISLGSSLLLSFLSKISLGVTDDEAHIIMHPIGFAGWIGLFVTALNLLPVGQLDGGHITYALFGRRHIWISRTTLIVILLLGVMRYWDGWLIWAILLFFLGVRHPSPLDSYTPLDFKRKVVGWLTLVILAITFIPAPFSIHEPDNVQQRKPPTSNDAPLVEAKLNGGP